jgi:hypothetical protein
LFEVGEGRDDDARHEPGQERGPALVSPPTTVKQATDASSAVNRFAENFTVSP